MTPNNREELLEVMAFERFFHDNGHGDSRLVVLSQFVGAIRDRYIKRERKNLEDMESVGLCIVPKMATVEMEIAGTEQWLCEAAMEDRSAANYTAMLNASPYISSALPHLTKSTEQHGGNND